MIFYLIEIVVANPKGIKAVIFGSYHDSYNFGDEASFMRICYRHKKLLPQTCSQWQPVPIRLFRLSIFINLPITMTSAR